MPETKNRTEKERHHHIICIEEKPKEEVEQNCLFILNQTELDQTVVCR